MPPSAPIENDEETWGDVEEALAYDPDPLADEESVSQVEITARTLKSDLKHRTLNAMKRQFLADLMPAPPAPGECWHVISNGRFDYWTWIPVMLGYIGRADEFYGSTWVLNRGNVLELFELIDSGLIVKTSVLSGLFTKRREGAVYATLLQGMRRRGQRFVCSENHAKVTLLANFDAGTYLTIEGSANYTANPRIEQNVLVNDEAIYRFHRDWMEEVLEHGCEGEADPKS